MPLKAIIFDVDGTLAETEELHRKAFNNIFQKYELDWQWDKELYKKLLKVAGGKERIRHYIDEFLPENDSKNPEYDFEFIKKIHLEKTDNYVSLLANSNLNFRIGVERLINEISKSNLKLAIATTTSHINVLKLLNNLQCTKNSISFDVLATGDQVKKQKPDPEVYLLALSKLQLKPQECIAIEDTNNGLIAASHAGIPTLITPSSYSYDEDFTKAAAVVDHLGDEKTPAKYLGGFKTYEEIINIHTLQEIHKNWLDKNKK